ncbi:Cytochrome c oxidase subunit 5b-1, mitochondrial [Capsicum annuum]|uniref:Cytochrome c oxidase subunit 5b-1, mitochondrial n=1 Tax=Capsicum annuum TaxID=4072 RepID=A0A1U8H4X0_CAPAN|nr:putative cytochrome c oxidase subunit 5b-like [Capsicum annuum]KAF3647146.1 Cytochrome c oxidase subunit 5b-1, mitochondrial [Capsicum annuum]PHT79443.1 Cytochrome c oxidase subunit 5b-1, mitochondrial [Capsicum annuum]
MWRRLSSQFPTLRSAAKSNRLSAATLSSPANLRPTVPFIARYFSTATGGVVKKVEDVMPIATGHEREELEAELQGKDILGINFPEGPFGTKEAPAIVKSYYDKRIVGCPGGEGEDEHDVVWFWLEKGKPHECPVCTQYFELEVVGPGGPPDGHGGDDDHH